MSPSKSTTSTICHSDVHNIQLTYPHLIYLGGKERAIGFPGYE